MFVFIFLSLLTIITANPILVIYIVNKDIEKPNNNTPIGNDYKYSPGIGHHKFHPELASFNDARKACIDEGGHLAIINSLAEEQVLKKIYAEAKTDEGRAYIGIHNYFSDNDWVTVLGDPISKAGFAEWDDGEPNNAEGVEHCGVLFRRGKLNDVPCTIRVPFFCEIPEF